MRVNKEMESMFKVVAQYAPRLRAAMPNAREINGDPDGEMQLTITDWNSAEAARVTLEKFGHAVDVFSVPAPFDWHIHFKDEEVGSEAVVFYNRLPNNMKRYKP